MSENKAAATAIAIRRSAVILLFGVPTAIGLSSNSYSRDPNMNVRAPKGRPHTHVW
jgi:hypothetical protein